MGRVSSSPCGRHGWTPVSGPVDPSASQRVALFETDLPRRAANHAALTPLSFLRRSAAVYPDKVAVIHGPLQYRYDELYRRCRALASALSRAGVRPGEAVSVLAPNVPPLLEAHYGVAMAGAILNAINTRLDAASIGFILEHAKTRVLIVDAAWSQVAAEAITASGASPTVVVYHDPTAADEAGQPGALDGEDYEAFLAGGDPDCAWQGPDDEWQAISLNYTSGTTGNPKGVVYSHRGACLNALGNVMTFGLDARSVYLWTLPMFHCNGWTYTWAVTAAGGTHVCLRRVERDAVLDSIRAHRVSHMCGAPIILNMLARGEGDSEPLPHTVEVATGGAAPPTTVIRALEQQGFRVTHLYGLTESYGPATVCVWQPAWDDLDLAERGVHMARQGVSHVTADEAIVADPQSGVAVPRDGVTMGEILLRGNTVMKGYLKNPEATDEALRDGWFRTGDLAVWHADGYIEIKDRSKDIIISGGENISSLEVEEVLYAHPAVLEAAVVARPDEKWGETPCAFVTLRAGAEVDDAGIIAWCRERMAHFKAPKTVIFGELPKTSTGKIQKHVLRERAAAC